MAATATISVVEVGMDFLVAAVGGVACGLLVFVVVAKVRRHVTEPTLDTSVSIVTPFIAYVVAEEIHASGVLAVVVAGLALGHKAPVLQTPSSRIAERLNWRTFAFLLENAVFLLIGLQTSWIVGEVSESPLSTATIVTACVATLVAVIVLRYLWLLPARFVLLKPDQHGRNPPRAYTILVGWAGMRGVVTLAAAFAIPEEVPGREVLLLIALFVTGGTLLIHGLTLPWLVRRLKVSPPDPREDALARAELLQAASRAGLDRLEEVGGRRRPARGRAPGAALADRAARVRRVGAARAPSRARVRRRASATRGCAATCWPPSGPGSWSCAAPAGSRTRSSRTCCPPSTSRSP